ncbi:hypothetical protein GGS21DRAFT_491056 [Xylaria nigripes]|nr:hypothetical protein GGS21DRAFT_491056 [Xylaria nigripes]
MVSLKKLFLFGVAILGVASALPALPSPNSALSRRDAFVEKDAHPIDATAISVTEGEEDSALIHKRGGRMTLQWSPQGRIFFLLGAKFPQSVVDSLYGLGEGGPAKVLLKHFQDWLFQNRQNHQRAFLLFKILKITGGGVYGKAGDEIGNDFGFALVTGSLPTAGDIQKLLEAITAWASMDGSLVQVLARPNGFFNPSNIGAGELAKRDVEERSRDNTCPASMDLLKYATKDVATDIDINRDIRWAGECDEA